MLGRIDERGLACVVLSLAVGCFSEPPPVGDGASGEGSTAAMETEGDAGGGTDSTTEGQAESASESSGEDSVGSTGSTGTGGIGTSIGTSVGTGTGSGAEATGVGTGSVPDCTVIYLNFGGVTLAPGDVDDATQNISSISYPELTGELAPYSGDVNTAVDMVSEHLDAFNVCLVLERPEDGDYEMVVITDTEPPLQFVTAMSAGADCGNTNPSEISFVFGTGGSENVPPGISSRIGFHIGLENGTNSADLMGPAGHPGPEFRDRCTGLNGPAACGTQHAMHCGAGSQNSFQELLDAFGSANR